MNTPREAASPAHGVGLFTVRVIHVQLDYSWFIVFALVLLSLALGYFPQAYPDQTARNYWTAGLAATLLFFVSVIAHELSHSFMALRSGLNVREISLFIFGSIARLSEEANNPKTNSRLPWSGH